MAAPLSTAPFTPTIPVTLFGRQQGTATDTPVAVDANGQILATISGGPITGPLNITGSSATEFTVAKAGANYQFQVDTSAAGAVTGLKVKGFGAGSGVTLAAISTGADENFSINAKGAGVLGLGDISTGGVNVGTAGGPVVIGLAGQTITLAAATSITAGGLVARGTPGATAVDVGSTASQIVVNGGLTGSATIGFNKTNAAVLAYIGINAGGTVIAGHTTTTSDLLFYNGGGLVSVLDNSGNFWQGGNGTFSAGTGAFSTSLQVGTGGSNASAQGASLILDVNSNGSGANSGAAYVVYARNRTDGGAVGSWQTGTGNQVSGAVGSINDYYFFTNSTYVVGISSAGALTTAAGITVQSGNISLATTGQIKATSGVISFSVVSTALTQGTAGSVILPNANMSGAANDAARDALAGNVDGAIAIDTGVAGRIYIRDGGAWKFVLAT